MSNKLKDILVRVYTLHKPLKKSCFLFLKMRTEL